MHTEMIFTPFINGSVSVMAINRINEKVVMKSHKNMKRREMKSENERKKCNKKETFHAKHTSKVI